MKCPVCGKENPETYWINGTEFKQKWCVHHFSDWIKEIERLKEPKLKIFVTPNNWNLTETQKFAELLMKDDPNLLVWFIRGETDEDPYLIKVKDVTKEELIKLMEKQS